MKESLFNNLQQLVFRHEEISGMLSDPAVIGDQNRFRELSREYARLEPVTKLFTAFEKARADRDTAEQMSEDPDNEIRTLGYEELGAATKQLETVVAALAAATAGDARLWLLEGLRDGLVSLGRRAVEAGLKSDEWVVVEGANRARPGVTVSI